MIRMRRVTKVYKGSVYALEDITLDIERGEFAFLVGPSGSGKSTFIKLLIKDEEPTGGQIYIADTNINQMRTSVFIKSYIRISSSRDIS